MPGIKKVTEKNSLFINHPKLLEEFVSDGSIDPFKISMGSGIRYNWKCLKCTEMYDQCPKNIINGIKCPYCCGKKIGKYNSLGTNYPDLVAEWHSKNILSPYQVTCHTSMKVWWKCKVNEKHEWDTSISNRTGNETGCPYCTGKFKSELNKIPDYLEPEFAHDLNELKFTDLSFGSTKRVYWRCLKKPEHIWKCSPNQRTSKKCGCPSCKSNISKKEKQWLDGLNIPNEYRQHPIGKYIVDAYDPLTNIVYEFNGDYWHGNPMVYNLDAMNEITSTTFRELYNYTIDKMLYLINNGYDLVIMWECDFDKIIDMNR